MRLGLSVTTHHAGVSPREAAKRVIDRVGAAAEGGLDHLTLGDHHAVGPSGQYLQNVPTLARLLAEWPSSRPSGLLFLLPLWHPVLVAEQIGTLAAFSDARFIVQTGIGSGRGQFEAFGASLSERGWRTDLAVDVVSRLLAGETVSDERLGVSAASIRPIPEEPVEWWIGAGAAPAAIDRAARLGDAWYVGPGPTRAELVRLVDGYREVCQRHGREPRITLRRDVYVGDDDAAAMAVGDRLADAGYRGISRDALVCGGVERVAEHLASFADLGVTDIAARCVDVAQRDAVRTIELLGVVRDRLVV